jgi:hypothetical protein
MENAYGHGFADVRVHTDSAADDAARMLRAHAFTTGSDLYFGRGNYRPDDPSGRRLLAHELAHVVQQRQGQAQSQAESWISSPGDASERQATAASEHVVAGRQPGPLSAAPAAPVQRYLWDEFTSDVGSAATGAWEGAQAVGGAVVEGAEAVGERSF